MEGINRLVMLLFRVFIIQLILGTLQSYSAKLKRTAVKFNTVLLESYIYRVDYYLHSVSGGCYLVAY